MAYDGCNYYFSFPAIFCPFTPVTAQKMKIKKKILKKKTPEDLIILQKCTKNHDHMLCCSWDMAWDICNCYFFILSYFLHFYSPSSPKNRNFKKMEKRSRDIIILHMCTKNYDQIMYGSWDMVRDGRTDGRTEKVTPPKKW